MTDTRTRTSKLTGLSILENLAHDGLISDAQLLTAKSRVHGHGDKHPIDQVASLNLEAADGNGLTLTSTKISQWLADRNGMDFVRLDPLKIQVEQVTQVMSQAFARRHQILAVDVSDALVTVVSADPGNNSWQAGLQQVLRKPVKHALASPGAIRRYTEEFYSLSHSVKGAHTSATEERGIGNLEQLIELGDSGDVDANDQHVIRIVDWLLQYAFEQRASDVHIEPRRNMGLVRFRIDGVLQKVYELPATITNAVVSRFKILGRMDVAEKRKPLDGRVKTKSPNGQEIELRLSTMPTAFGEKFVGRIFDPTVLTKEFSDLGLDKNTETQWLEMVSNPTGIVLVTGPTGSGKTTTLYTSLKHLATSEVNVCTIEDPIEMVEPALNQMQVHHEIGLDFASGVRTLLRQDPDIIMVGEIRDRETAEMAVQAALTGHLVISTLHTNDAPSAITRLIDIGVEPYLINASLLGVMAQRLVRILCPNCKVEAVPDEKAWQQLIGDVPVKTPETVYLPKGCEECRQTGYSGRQGVYELMAITPQQKALIVPGVNDRIIREQALKDGMYLLRISGARKVAQGLTTIEEVMRVAPAAD